MLGSHQIVSPFGKCLNECQKFSVIVVVRLVRLDQILWGYATLDVVDTRQDSGIHIRPLLAMLSQGCLTRYQACPELPSLRVARRPTPSGDNVMIEIMLSHHQQNGNQPEPLVARLCFDCFHSLNSHLCLTNSQSTTPCHEGTNFASPASGSTATSFLRACKITVTLGWKPMTQQSQTTNSLQI